MIRTHLLLGSAALALTSTIAAPAFAADAADAADPQAAPAQDQAAEEAVVAEEGEIIVDGTRPIAESEAAALRMQAGGAAGPLRAAPEPAPVLVLAPVLAMPAPVLDGRPAGRGRRTAVPAHDAVNRARRQRCRRAGPCPESGRPGTAERVTWGQARSPTAESGREDPLPSRRRSVEPGT